MKGKPEGWDSALTDCINEGLGFKETNDKMTGVMGEEARVGASTYRKHKNKLKGGPDVEAKLGAIGEVVRDEPKEKPKKKLAPWTKGKQTAADNSKLAQIANKGIYAGLMPFCKNKALTEQDVQDVNFGGAIVGTIQHYVPDLNLDHPLIILATRGIILYMKFKAICGKIQDIKNKVSDVIGGAGIGGAIKQEWKKEEHR